MVVDSSQGTFRALQAAWAAASLRGDGRIHKHGDAFNLPLRGQSCSEAVVRNRTPVEAALRVLGGSDATIGHGFERAMYLPELDEIRLPWPKRFTSVEGYCATSLHELVHHSGHPSRLNRQFGKRFGDAAYAFEELVAELGFAFVMGHCGLVRAWRVAAATTAS